MNMEMNMNNKINTGSNSSAEKFKLPLELEGLFWVVLEDPLGEEGLEVQNLREVTNV